MIRDPSDGSVKSITPVRNENNELAIKAPAEGITRPVIETSTSGLQTGSAKPENIARLQRSREWLADYRAGKIKADSE